MNYLEHDPRTKQQIKDALYMFLYGPVQKQFKDHIDNLIIRNTLVCGFSHKHFTYKGTIYTSDVTPSPVKKNRLHPSLRVQMEDYLSDLTDLNNHELPYVLGFINQVLNASTSLNDYIRVFPESVHHPINKLMSTCPCRTTSLATERVESLMLKNEEPINMIKRRLVSNLLI